MPHAADNGDPGAGAPDDSTGKTAPDEPREPARPASTFRLILGAIALQAGTKFLTNTIDRKVLGTPPMKGEAPLSPKKPGKIRSFASRRLAGIASKSVPGAVAVSGGLLAKYIFDRGGKRLKEKRRRKDP